MITPHSAENQSRSDQGHLLAQTEIYPKWLDIPFERISFEGTQFDPENPDTMNSILDGKLAVDKIIHISWNKGRIPISITVQERHRATWAQRYQDITITEWNNISNVKGELYKLKAQFFLYTYFDHVRNKFVEAIIVNAADLLIAISTGKIPFNMGGLNARSDQSFLTVKFHDIFTHRLYRYYENFRAS